MSALRQVVLVVFGASVFGISVNWQNQISRGSRRNLRESFFILIFNNNFI